MLVALIIQHAKRMRRITLSSAASPVLQHLFTISHKRYDFREGEMLLNIKCVFWFFLQILSETFFILRRMRQDIIIRFYRFLCKLPVIFFRVWSHLNSLDRFSENNQIPNFVNISPVGGEMFYTDGRTDRWTDRQTDMTKLIVAFRNFENASKNTVFCDVTP